MLASMSSLLLIVAIALGSPKKADTPEPMRGVAWGSTEAEARRILPDLTCQDLKRPLEDHLDRGCVDHFTLSEKVPIECWFEFYRDRLVKVVWKVALPDMLEIHEVLSARYGTPALSSSSAGGTSISVAAWVHKGLSITTTTAKMPFSGEYKSEAAFELASWAKTRDDAEGARRKKAAESF